jgi:hypothetical protein
MIDATKAQKLMESFYEMTNVPSLLIDPGGNVLKVNKDKMFGAA